jgi:hypothetical protein
MRVIFDIILMMLRTRDIIKTKYFGYGKDY